MTPLSEIPTDAISFLIGAAACLVLGGKSWLHFHRSRDDLSRYMAWFALLTGIALAMFSVPSFFTLNESVLLFWGVAGEFPFFAAMVAQAAIMWFLIIRPRFPVYYLIVPVAILGLAAAIYAVPYTQLTVEPNFILFQNPRFTALIIAALMLGLFGPVGIYFLKMAPRQDGFKSMLNAVSLSVVYLGVGVAGAGFEIIAGSIMTHFSVVTNTIFFSFFLLGVLWPRRADARLPLALGTDQVNTRSV
jgi:hypothetical protein